MGPNQAHLGTWCAMLVAPCQQGPKAVPFLFFVPPVVFLFSSTCSSSSLPANAVAPDQEDGGARQQRGTKAAQGGSVEVAVRRRSTMAPTLWRKPTLHPRMVSQSDPNLQSEMDWSNWYIQVGIRFIFGKEMTNL
jgi:hypothetical protein